jgi:hypothetical protein
MFKGTPSKQSALLSDIMRQLDDVPPDPAASRRRARRCDVRTSFSAILVDIEQHPQVRIYTRNISTSGIGFVSRRQFKIDERIAVAIKWPNAEGKILVAKVTFSSYIRKGMYETGAEFQHALLESQASTTLKRLIGS